MAKTDILCNNPGSRVGHAFFVFAFLLVVVASITSLALFALKHDEIQDARPDDSTGHCILYLDQAQVESKNLGGGDFCRFAIYGSGTVALGAAIYLIGYVIKCVVGAKLLTCLLIVEIPLLFCIAAVSLAHSLNTAIGLALTCQAYQNAGLGSNCMNNTYPEDMTFKSGTKFFQDILISEIMSWAVTGTLTIVFIIYVVLAVVFWRQGTKPKKSTI